MMSEEWRTISHAEGYEVSSFGRIGSWLPRRNYAPETTERRILKLSVDKDGYARTTLYIKGNPRFFRVCRLVAEAWHGSPEEGQVVRHLDGSRDNDIPSNLRWGTPKENSADSKKHGTARRGEDINTCKLSEEAVIEILKSDKGPSELARQYGVTPGAISHIRKGRSWNHVSI